MSELYRRRGERWVRGATSNPPVPHASWVAELPDAIDENRHTIPFEW